MKSWNGLGEDAPFIAPPRGLAAPAGDRIRLRALVLTFVTCIGIVGLGEFFPGGKNGFLPGWWMPSTPGHYQKPFEWSQV